MQISRSRIGSPGRTTIGPSPSIWSNDDGFATACFSRTSQSRRHSRRTYAGGRKIWPRVHNLVRLAELAGLQPDENQASTLADLNAFSQAGRYPDATEALPTPEEADAYIQRAQEVFRWLMTGF